MQRRFGLVACIILMLCLPLASAGVECAEEAGPAAEPRNAPRDVIPGREEDAASPLSSPTIWNAYRPYPAIERFEGATPSGAFRTIGEISLWESGDVPIRPVQHRGDLVLEPSALDLGTGRACFGPDTPPPSTGDWLVDGSGNIVDNTTVVLNGNLKVTTGELTLDNVTLVMNCTTDGQYGLNVSAGGVLNLMNCNITAFSGALHYKFAVYGEMTMDRCNVSEMWGDPGIWWEGGGVALFSDAAIIRSSTISKGETTGIQVHGSAGPVITDTNISDNRVYGLFTCEYASPRIHGSTINSNRMGADIAGSSSPAFLECTFSLNTMCGAATWLTSTPVFTNCTFEGSENGIQTGGSSNPVFTNCTISGSNSSGIAILGTSTPKFTDCTSGPNRLGIGTGNNSAPVFKNCTFRSNVGGIETYGYSIPSFTNCSVLDSNWTGISAFEHSAPVFSNCTSFSGRSSDYGIQTTDNSAPVFKNCTSSGSKDVGIGTFIDSAPLFMDCISSGAVQVGIVTGQRSQPAFINCTALNSNWDGINTQGDSRAAFTNCISSGSKNVGITTWERSHPTFTNCISSKSHGPGIGTIDNSHPQFTNCTVLDSNECGIDTEGDSTPEFINCTSSGSIYHGIEIIQNSMPVFTDCISKGNNMSGVVILISSAPKLSNCTASGNNGSGIVIGGAARPVITDCTSFNNKFAGLMVLEGASPRLEGIHLSGNGGQNLWATSSTPLFLPNSTLAGGSSVDIQLGNGSRLTLLNTTYTSEPLVGPDAQLKVQWYLSFRTLDRANRPLAGAVVDGAGRNGSRIQAVQSGPDGMAADLVATEYIKNGSTAEQERTCYAPYDLSVTVDGETNTTYGIPADRTLSWRLYFDHAPRFSSAPDTLVTEDQPTVIDLAPHLSDQDDPVSRLGLSTDRDYVVADNSTHTLVVNCPYHIESDVVTVTVSDGLRNSSRALDLQIIPVNDRPACRKPIPDLEAVEDEALTVDLAEYMWDEESGGRLTFTCNFGEIAIDNLLRRASWTPGEGNSSLPAVVFSASDGYLVGNSNAFNITFIRVNDAPVYLGGLADATVEERRNWTLDLRSCFRDEEDTGGLKFEASNPAVVIDNLRHAAFWSPSGNAGFSIEVQFTAHDASNYTMTAESTVITLTYLPVNDPPEFLGTLKGVRVKPGEEWNITLEDYFRDDDTGSLRFSSNNPNVKIIELNKTRHCAVWKPDRYSNDVTGLVFTAYDGRTYTRSDPITLDVDAPADVEKPPPVTNVILRIPLYVYILLPAGILAGVAAFYAYRRVKYGKYTVEQVFLVNKDGRLLAHKSRKESPGGGEDILSGMLTALQGFIKEFMRDEKQGELEEMKYGDLKIVIERGRKVYLAVFLSGYVTDGLRSSMREILAGVDAKMGAVLDSWDGTVKLLEGLDKPLEALMKEPKAPQKPPK